MCITRSLLVSQPARLKSCMGMAFTQLVIFLIEVRLMLKLKACGIHGPLLQWFHSLPYYVLVEKEFVINVILTGVVYLEVFLWYLFWVLYCSNFVHHNFSFVVKSKMKIFAGDIILYREVSTHKACALLQEDFNHVFDWLGSGK